MVMMIALNTSLYRNMLQVLECVGFEKHNGIKIHFIFTP